MTRQIFVDTGYWIAILNPNDDLHQRAKSLSKTLKQVRLVTTDFVLSETLAYFGLTQLRLLAAKFVDGIYKDPNIELVPATRDLFLAGLSRYRKYADKAWSHVDCTSFEVMTNHSITEALAHDIHFEQAGFKALLRDES